MKNGLTSITKKDGKTYWFTQDGVAVCGAKTKNGNPNMRSPCKDSNRCALHGGKSVSGQIRIHKKGTHTLSQHVWNHQMLKRHININD